MWLWRPRPPVDINLTGSLSIIVERSPPPSRGHVQVTTRIDGITQIATAGEIPMAFIMSVDRMIDLAVGYVDGHGNPTQVDGPVTWQSSDEEIATATALDGSPQSKQINVRPVGKLGNCRITAQADADLGEGVRTIYTPFDLTIVAGEAVSGTITPVGEPVPIPPIQQPEPRPEVNPLGSRGAPPRR